MAFRKIKIAMMTLFIAWTTLNGSGLLLGDRTSTTDGDSFSFTLLGKSVFDATNEYFYVAAGAAPKAGSESYALAGTTTGAKIGQKNGFVAFAPETVTLNGTSGTANPLYNKQIAQLGMVGTNPVAVPSNDTDAIYWIISKLSSSTQAMVGVTAITDAGGNNSDGVVTTSGATTLVGGGGVLFAAVKPNGGNFGDPSGGIAVFTRTNSALTQEKAVHGNNDDVRAVEITTTTEQVKQGSSGDNLTSLVNDAVDLHWDAVLKRLYIGIRSTGVPEAGARGVVVGYIDNQGSDGKKLRLTPIAPVEAFTAQVSNEIVGNRADEAIHIYRVRTMHTSTGLSYLVVQGNANNADHATSLYALPLVNESVDPAKSSSWQKSTTHGTLAKASSTPTNYFQTASKNGIQYLPKRGFQTPATAAGDLLNSTDNVQQIRIGGGTVSGTISDVHVYKDTVFVSTSADGSTEKIGVFYSQAIFDVNGAIINWTPWQRVSYHSTASVASFAFAPIKGQFFILEGANGAPDTVKRTEWGTASAEGILGGITSDASVGFIETLAAEFPREQEGIMGLFDFPDEAAYFNQNAESNLSLMVATGYKKVVIIRSGTDTGGRLIATTGDFAANKRTFTNGAINASSVEGGALASNTNIISVSGGDLNDLGAISCAEIVGDGATGGYIAVGGVGGVALLRASDYSGWATTGLVQDLSTGFGTDRSFQKIGNYKNVRKIWAADTDGGAGLLYILTDDTLYRIATSTLNTVNPTPTVVATLAGLGLPSYASFADFIASKKIGLLATSHGLYRTGNGKNLSTAGGEVSVGWTAVTLPTSFTGVTKLIPVTAFNLPTTFSADNVAPSQVYYVASTVSQENAALGRLVVAATQTAAVDANTVQVVANPTLKASDGTVTDGPLSFLGNYRSCFATNGATLLAASPRHLETEPKLVRLPLLMGVGIPFNYKAQKDLSLSMGKNDSSIRGIVRNGATGSWIVYGDFGLRVLE